MWDLPPDPYQSVYMQPFRSLSFPTTCQGNSH